MQEDVADEVSQFIDAIWQFCVIRDEGMSSDVMLSVKHSWSSL